MSTHMKSNYVYPLVDFDFIAVAREKNACISN